MTPCLYDGPVELNGDTRLEITSPVHEAQTGRAAWSAKTLNGTRPASTQFTEVTEAVNVQLRLNLIDLAANPCQ
jgi:hypothetical protein